MTVTPPPPRAPITLHTQQTILDAIQAPSSSDVTVDLVEH